MKLTIPLACAAVSGLTAAVLAVPPSAAGADDAPTRVVLTDPLGDVWTISEGEDEEYVLAGDEPTADVVRAVVRHRAAKVVVKMQYVDLRRVDPQAYFVTLDSSERFRALLLQAGPGRWSGTHQLLTGNFGAVRCPRLTHSIDYAAEQVVATVPRSCLGGPAWVRADLQSYLFRGETEESFEELTDNPHNDRAEGAFTPKVYRAG